MATDTPFHGAERAKPGKHKNFLNFNPNEMALDGKVHFHKFCKTESFIGKPWAPYFDFFPGRVTPVIPKILKSFVF